MNKKSACSKKTGQRLWDVAKSFPCQGELKVSIPAKDTKPARDATLEIRFGSFTMNPSKNNANRKVKKLPKLKLNLVYVIENTPPDGVEPLEWYC